MLWTTGWRRRRAVAAVNEAEASLQAAFDDDLLRQSNDLRRRAEGGAKTAKLLVESLALMREACRRTLGLRHYDAQLFAGAALCERKIVEMQTGEGKTLTAALPSYLFALFGHGAYVATSNDYLAARDATWLRPAFARLGISVGAITSGSTPAERRAAYHCDVTYGTGKEFGFDFLRDRLQAGPRDRGLGVGIASATNALQRRPFFMLVDEADQVMIDDAGTPLILSSAAAAEMETTAARFLTAARLAATLVEGTHYQYVESRRRVELTAAGREQVRNTPIPAGPTGGGRSAWYEDVERALLARRNYVRDRQYVVRDGRIAIIDESTGRIAEGRKWRDGLHQAIEAQEGLTITTDGGTAARITVQEFFRRFPNLAGLTGTASGAAREFRAVYEAPVCVVPPHRPARRTALPPQVFATARDKLRAVVQEVSELHAAGRPVLVGTKSIAQSEQLSQQLTAVGIEHVVLNARETAREAEIIALAGTASRVTVATNMAGRGTDIALGTGVAERGGLHVILTEMHEAARIDRQFIGRGARQGDPGSYRIFVSFEDDLLAAAWGAERAAALIQRVANERAIPPGRIALFYRAQRLVEREHDRRRRRLIETERHRTRIAAALGLDSYLDLPE